MIRGVLHTALLVRDYDEAKRFYCEKLGFELVEDTLLPAGKRWVRVRAPGSQGPDILLSRAVDDQLSAVGNQAGGHVLFFLHTDDLSADCERMRASGIEFVEEPRQESYGKVAVCKDLYGNRIDLIEPPQKRTSKEVLDLSPKLRQTVKSQNTGNGNFDSWEFQDERLRAR